MVDGRPRYHLTDCPHLRGRPSEPLPVSEAVELGFTPCGRCEPDDALLADIADAPQGDRARLPPPATSCRWRMVRLSHAR